MLLHNYLQLKSAIYTKAKAEVHTLLAGITDPKMKEAVDDWDFGDPITDVYPQVDQKKEVEMVIEAEPVVKVEPPVVASPPAVEPVIPAAPVIPEGVIGSLAPIEPVIAPVVEAVKPEENTNHTA